MDLVRKYHWTFLLCIGFFIQQANAQQDQRLIRNDTYQNLTILPVNSVNSPYLEFSPIKYKDGFLYWASTPKKGSYDKEIDHSFFEMRFHEVEAVDESLTMLIDSLNNLEIHKGPGSFSLDETKFYFTLEHRASNPAKRSVLKIAQAVKKAGQWVMQHTGLEMLQQYSYCHPAVDETHKIMILASDMPGGYGGMDLYISRWEENQWTALINLGPEINSPANELFPYIYENKMLFYASDKEGGYGGLDLYLTDLNTGRQEILRAPMNSPADDFGILLSEDSYEGYFSSSRLGNQLNDDIFHFVLQKPMLIDKPVRQIEESFYSLWVREASTGEPVEGAKLWADTLSFDCERSDLSNFHFNIEGDSESPDDVLIRLTPKASAQRSWKYQSDSMGLIKIPVNRSFPTLAFLKKEGFLSQKLVLDPFGESHQQDIFLHESVMKTVPATDEDEVIQTIIGSLEPGPLFIAERKGAIKTLKTLRFEENSSNILRGSTDELELLAAQLKHNPDLRIELSAHTESRGNDEKNLQLSENRALSAGQFLEALGVKKTQIVPVGFGERFILNRCINGVPCTDDEHLVNRRVEIRVLDL